MAKALCTLTPRSRALRLRVSARSSSARACAGSRSASDQEVAISTRARVGCSG
jgi:hypothetical protein